MNKLLLLLLAGCAACTSQAQDPVRSQTRGETAISTAPAPAAESSTTLAEIRRQIGPAACSESAQCRTLPVGARACGGPEDYLAYATGKTDESALRALAERSTAEGKARNTATGQMSICMLKPDPGAVCVAGACQLGSAAPAN